MQIQSAISGAAIYSGMFIPNMLPNMFMDDVIQTRFGEIVVNVEKAVAFPSGLLGMPDKNSFVLTNFNSPKMAQFTLLQSLDDSQFSLITLPLDINNSIIAAVDIRGAADDLRINHADLVTLLVVSVHRSFDKTLLSVNARAPLFIDAKRKIGTQFVLTNDDYKVQHML